MPVSLIKTLIEYLPRFAEEEGDFFCVKRGDLVDALCRQHGIERPVAEITVLLCESLLNTLSVLQPDYLANGEWSFVSFPAQLLATSVLTAISDDDSRLFAANFWNTQGISNDKKEQQRKVLNVIETARVENHATHEAQPVRYIYVAWGVIKLDGKILFYQREDTKKRHDKTAGDYGLIGGRANQADVRAIEGNAALLKALQSPNVDVVKAALPETLKRELFEEAGLRYETHYTFKLWRTLKPYRQVQGAANNHALTEYYLDIFQVDLTLEGYLFLQQKIKDDEFLAWFSVADLGREASADGKIAYIKALEDEFSGDRSAMVKELTALPDSFANRYLFEREKYGVTFPLVNTSSVLAGVLGKEKPLELKFTPRQLATLLGLAAHLRGFEFDTVDGHIVFHPFGWVEVVEQSDIQAELLNLMALLNGSDLIMENRRDVFFRLSVNPDLIFFDERLFSYSVSSEEMKSDKTKIPATLHRSSFDTALGSVNEVREEFTLTRKFAHKLQTLSEQHFATDNDEVKKIEDIYKKGLHKDPRFKALGLRNMIRQEDGLFKFVVRIQPPKINNC